MRTFEGDLVCPSIPKVAYVAAMHCEKPEATDRQEWQHG
jgi:hypothetical protein